MGGHGLDRAGSGQVQVTGTCECGNEPSGSTKCEEFLDQLKTGYLLKKGSAAWNKNVLRIKSGMQHTNTFILNTVNKKGHS